MPGGIPGPLGAAAFVSLKFGGYLLAAAALKKLQPAITASALKIAAARTGLGVLIAPLFTVATVWLASLFAPDASLYGVYAILCCVRILIWALVLFFILKTSGSLRPSSLVTCACGSHLVEPARLAGVQTSDYSSR